MSITISYKHASLMRRLFAALLDGVLIGWFGSFIAVCFIQSGPNLEGVDIILSPALFFTEIFGFPVALPLAILSLLSFLGSGNTVGLWCWLPLLISPIYHGVMESLPTKATLGKLIMGIFVSDLNGNKISFMRAMFRYLAKGLSTLTFGVGYFMALGKAGQALHDKLTGCIVLRKE